MREGMQASLQVCEQEGSVPGLQEGAHGSWSDVQKGEGLRQTWVHLEEGLRAALCVQARVHHQVSLRQGEGVRQEMRSCVQDGDRYLC